MISNIFLLLQTQDTRLDAGVCMKLRSLSGFYAIEFDQVADDFVDYRGGQLASAGSVASILRNMMDNV